MGRRKYPRWGGAPPINKKRRASWEENKVLCDACSNTAIGYCTVEYGYMKGTDHEDYKLCGYHRSMGSKNLRFLIEDLTATFKARKAAKS